MTRLRSRDASAAVGVASLSLVSAMSVLLLATSVSSQQQQQQQYASLHSTEQFSFEAALDEIQRRPSSSSSSPSGIAVGDVTSSEELALLHRHENEAPSSSRTRAAAVAGLQDPRAYAYQTRPGTSRLQARKVGASSSRRRQPVSVSEVHERRNLHVGPQYYYPNPPELANSFPPASANPYESFFKASGRPSSPDAWASSEIDFSPFDQNSGSALGYTIACTDFHGRQGRCLPFSQCTRFSKEIGTSSGEGACDLGEETVGVCCPVVDYESKNRGQEVLLQTIDFSKASAPGLSQYDVDEACYSGLAVSDNWSSTENRLLQENAQLTPLTPAYYHHGLVRVLTQAAVNNSRSAIAGMATTLRLIKEKNLNPVESGFALKGYTLEETILAPKCPLPPRCRRESEFYRTIDGSCNNPENPTWGQAKTGTQRLLPPTYEDGVFAPRSLSVTGEPLPSPRALSASIVGDIDRPHPIFTNLVSDWGQFIDHDFARAGMFKLDAMNNTAIRCCNEGQFIDPSPHPACLPIEIPDDDPFYSRFDQVCMEFVRSLPAFDCRLGYVDQMNQVTHWIDASTVYGSEDDVAANLRLFSNGQLEVLTTLVARPLLPLQDADGGGCTNVTQNRRCFDAGDNRVNQNVMLVLFHTVLVREHNRVAAELQTINPQWNDELLFQEARRIVIGQVQHITYNEWLRLLLGERAYEAFGLNPLEQGFSNDYDPSFNPSIMNEFSTAGYRLHSLPSGNLRPLERGQKRSTGPGLLLRDLFFDPVIAFSPTDSENFIRGLATQPVQLMDNLMSVELTNHLFEGNNPFGLDLASLNIQRGRDHGLPTYNSMREACGLPRARNFKDLADVIPAKVLDKMERVYAHVDDVDLFLAGISERPIDPDSFLGPTFACLVADQFAKLKRGDRFFYEFSGHPAAFTKSQLAEIRKASMARLFCDNTDVGEMQPLVFIQPSRLNHRVNCNSTAIPRLNLRPWRDTRFRDTDSDENLTDRRTKNPPKRRIPRPVRTRLHA